MCVGKFQKHRDFILKSTLCRLQNSHNLVWPSVADIMSEMVCSTGDTCDNTNPHTHKHVFHIVEIDCMALGDRQRKIV